VSEREIACVCVIVSVCVIPVILTYSCGFGVIIPLFYALVVVVLLLSCCSVMFVCALSLSLPPLLLLLLLLFVFSAFLVLCFLLISACSVGVSFSRSPLQFRSSDVRAISGVAGCPKEMHGFEVWYLILKLASLRHWGGTIPEVLDWTTEEYASLE
jgi:hypothetical protein